MNQFQTFEDNGMLNLRQCCVLIPKLSNFELRKYNVIISETEEGKIPKIYSYHPGLDEYIIEFEKFLRYLKDENKKHKILQELEEKNIEKDLVIQMESGDYKTNEKLVRWIIGNQPDYCRLEINWNFIDQAVRVLKYQELKNKSKRKK